jgi:hypothetical protein
MKYAVVTTFPSKSWGAYVERCLKSFHEKWDKNIPIYIQIDDNKYKQDLVPLLKQTLAGRNVLVCDTWEQNHAEFIERNKDKDVKKDFRRSSVKFCHKVFTLDKVASFAKEECLIWYDADIETLNPVGEKELDEIIKADVCYLGRKEWPTSETGFISFKLPVAQPLIRKWAELYETDQVMKHPEWTDAYAFDRAREAVKIGYHNWSEGVAGRDVFDKTVLSKLMTHHKGPLKNAQHENKMSGNTFNVDNMQIVTKNCVDHEVIKKNVSANVALLPHDRWISPRAINNEDIVICSAGPSLSVDEILPWHEKGVKIVAVKHALDALAKEKIKPWAVILLDPRPHVAEFVQYPDKDVIYFVSSMIDPKVTKHLLDLGANVYGYHAMVGAGEEERTPAGHWRVEGGSATATRGISLLKDLGFRKFHLYGYDCCYFKKPDLNHRKDNGRMKYEEVTLSALTWGMERQEKTFWTEGQFLAQVQEFEKIYLSDDELEIHTYGDGIIPWVHKHKKKFDAWKKRFKQSRVGTKPLEELLGNH